ncbi:hypothetical protein ACJX0J_021957, partial [Zea mays]
SFEQNRQILKDKATRRLYKYISIDGSRLKKFSNSAQIQLCGVRTSQKNILTLTKFIENNVYFHIALIDIGQIDLYQSCVS